MIQRDIPTAQCICAVENILINFKKNGESTWLSRQQISFGRKAEKLPAGEVGKGIVPTKMGLAR